MWWIVAAILSAVFAGLTAILSKCGVKNANSDVATAVRTSVVRVMAWLIVFITGAYSTIAQISVTSWIFLILSGLATGASWICYYYAIQQGLVSVVVPIDRAEHIDNSALLYHRVQGKAVLEGLDRPGVADNRYGVHGRIYLDIIKL